MQVPVDQSGSPVLQSAPCAPQKSSEKIQDNDGPDCNDDEYEDGLDEDVSPSKSQSVFRNCT